VEEVLSFGGTGSGSDIALILKGAGSGICSAGTRRKKLEIRERLAMPSAN